MKILLADDDVNIHLIVQIWLKRDGHEVVSAYNGAEALAKLKEGGIEGLITDVNMPLIKGVDLVRQVLRLPQKPNLIMVLTSRCDIRQLRQEMNHPDVHFFNKPFSPAVLAELIEKLAKERSTHYEHDAGISLANPA